MKKTRVSELLGIEYPIIQGGMTWIAGAELAAAVSEAGGLGVLSPNAGMEPSATPVEHLRILIRKTKSLTSKPFGVNFPVLGTPKEMVDVAIEEGVKVVTTSAGNPATYTSYLKDAGVKVIHVIASVRHAQGAERRGVDAVVAEGYEAGGHNGFDELTTMTLVPQVVDAVSVPVIAAGGIADSRGLVAALALGAEGVQIGTRFVATTECLAHPNFKDALVKAEDTGTVITGRKLGPTRGLKNEVTEKLLEMESRGASAEELQAFLGMARARVGQLEGNLVEGEGYCGAISGMIKDIVSTAEVMKRLIDGYDAVVTGLK